MSTMTDKLDRLLRLIKAEESFKQGFDIMVRAIMGSFINENKEAAIAAAERVFHRHIGWSAARVDLIEFYSANYTESEIDQMIEFHGSAVGQKMTALQPLVSTYLQEKQKPRMAALMPVFDELIMKEVKGE